MSCVNCLFLGMNPKCVYYLLVQACDLSAAELVFSAGQRVLLLENQYSLLHTLSIVIADR